MDAKRKLMDLKNIAKNVAKPILKEQGSIQVVSHFDADGICAGTIMYKALQYLGKTFELSFVKQLDSSVLKSMASNPKDMIIFTDLGSGQLDIIRKYFPETKIVVADHHQPVNFYWSELSHLNPHLVGLDGKDDISGAGIVYILCRELSVRTKNLVEFALVGAVGDMQQKGDDFLGINNLFLEEAEFLGLVKKERGLRLFGRYTRPLHKALEYSTDPYVEGISGSESGAIQFLSDLGIPVKTRNGDWKTLSDLTKAEEKKLATALVIESVSSNGDSGKLIGSLYRLSNNYDIREFATLLNACGRLDQPLEGVKLCLGSRKVADDINKEYRRRLARAVYWYNKNKKGFKRTKNAMYIVAGDNVDDNFIGTVLSIAIRKGIDTNILFGFANTGTAVKVSARAKKSRDGINLGKAIREAS
ncbi:MAG: DHH family phosphoesterase, partial [Candidatus Aenigmarchaeota archaeon]|nr:DHH family phosphoesterase [Candidatus Aenigmarchaeota archaeon]